MKNLSFIKKCKWEVLAFAENGLEWNSQSKHDQPRLKPEHFPFRGVARIFVAYAHISKFKNSVSKERTARGAGGIRLHDSQNSARSRTSYLQAKRQTPTLNICKISENLISRSISNQLHVWLTRVRVKNLQTSRNRDWDKQETKLNYFVTLIGEIADKRIE